jgi:hypothetical protein
VQLDYLSSLKRAERKGYHFIRAKNRFQNKYNGKIHLDYFKSLVPPQDLFTKIPY